MKICELCGGVMDEDHSSSLEEKVKSLHICEGCLADLPNHQRLQQE